MELTHSNPTHPPVPPQLPTGQWSVHKSNDGPNNRYGDFIVSSATATLGGEPINFRFYEERGGENECRLEICFGAMPSRISIETPRRQAIFIDGDSSLKKVEEMISLQSWAMSREIRMFTEECLVKADYTFSFSGDLRDVKQKVSEKFCIGES